jgi:hypothetical protein
MSNIQPYNNTAPHPIIKAERSGKKLKEASGKEITIMLANIVVITGIGNEALPDIEKPSEEAYARSLYAHIRELMSGYTTEEVILAFKLAVKREIDADMKLYGQLISVNYLMNVVSKYQEYKRHNKPKPEALPNEPLKQLAIGQQEQKKIMHEGFACCYLRYVKTGQLIDFGGVNFKFAKTNNLFDGFGIYENDIKAKTELAYTNDLKNKMYQTISRVKREAIKLSIKDIDQGERSYQKIKEEQMLSSLFDAMKYTIREKDLYELLNNPLNKSL